jgi:hypothetical protein
MEKLELPQEVPSGLVFKLGVTFCTHPLEVSKTLIQVLFSSIFLVFKLGVKFCTHPLEVSKTLIQVPFSSIFLSSSLALPFALTLLRCLKP